ncbi:MAG: metallophosphoesterase [Shinella sp.]|nr:metallophosphoesterase [Shinella sp.]
MPPLRFGVIADPQYAAIERHPRMERYYAKSLDKLAEAIAVFNDADLAFVVTLGDIIDRDWESYDAVLSVYGRLRHRAVFLPGNHDFAVAPERLAEVHRRLAMPAPWHHFAEGAIRFVVLDGNEVSLFSTPAGDPRRVRAEERLAALKAAGAINAYIWNGGIGEAQLAWLKDVLAAAGEAGEKVIVMGHYPLCPLNEHNLWNAGQVVEVLTASKAFRAYLCGHNHDGNYATAAGRHFVNFRGMVDTRDTNAFAIVEIHRDRLEIKGFGREQSRTLGF